MDLTSEHACFGGTQRFYKHDSSAIGLPMRFAIYIPPKPHGGVLFYLAGLTCTEETFATKAGAQRFAAEEGLILVSPDTSPRDTGAPGESEAWDFGAGAGFYLDATQSPWENNYRMESYVHELREMIISEFDADPARIGICGHSMGGHGALTLALRRPGAFRSVSAFAPIVAPTQCPWGQKAFKGYLGEDREAWLAHDASVLMARQEQAPYPHGILIDQGMGDKFLQEQLNPELFEEACRMAGQPLELRRHANYDHGYYFITTFIADHVRFHGRQLGTAS